MKWFDTSKGHIGIKRYVGSVWVEEFYTHSVSKVDQDTSRQLFLKAINGRKRKRGQK